MAGSTQSGPIRSTNEEADRPENTQAVLTERARLAALGADVGTALVQGGSLQNMLHHCTEAMVRHLEAAFARIWTVALEEGVLELQASAGMYTRIDGTHARVPIGQFKIGLIAEERQQHLTDAVVGDRRIHDQEWAKREGMVAFAGYPLIVEDRLVGVMAIFARKPLTEATLQAMASVANNIALGIEHKRAEHDLQKSQQRLELALWSSGLGSWDWNLETGEVVYDDRWAEMLGYRLPEIEPHVRSWVKLMCLDDVPQVMKVLNEHLEGRTLFYETEHRLRTKSGEWKWVLIRGKVVERDEHGIALRITGTHLDITERKHIEDRVRRQEAELAHVLRVATMGQMASELAHEINQPLGAIANFADGLVIRLRDGVIEDEPMLDVAQQIAVQARRAAEVIRSLRGFVRKGEARRERCDVNRLVREAAHFVEPDARRFAIAVRIVLDPGTPSVDVNRILIQQVVLNLLRNGIEAMAESDRGDHELLIQTSGGKENTIQVMVRDTGIGLPLAAGNKIFDAFFTTKANGLGMGLSISRSIVDDHGGRLWAAQNLGRGATFGFSLPVSNRASTDVR